MKHTKKSATALAILAATLYAINVPLSKVLLEHVGTTMMAAFLYLGAGLGLLLYGLGQKGSGQGAETGAIDEKGTSFYYRNGSA